MKRVVFVAIALMTLAAACHATQVIVSTSTNQIQVGVDNMGWWSNGRLNTNPTNDNYVTSSGLGIVENSFFSFDLTGVSGVVTAATFRVRAYDHWSPLTLGLWDVSTPAPVLITTRNAIQNPAIVADLGSGVSYGAFPVAPGPSQEILSFTLNAAALSDINAQIGRGYFSIGAAVEGTAMVVIFGASNDEPGNTGGLLNSVQNLVLEVSAVPEPQTLATLLAGLGIVGFLTRRRPLEGRTRH